MGKRAPGKLEHLLDAVGSAALFLLMAVVFVDVVGRNLFNSPLPWGTELLEVVVAVMIFALYPLLALRAGHITVDLIAVRSSLQRLQRAIACIVGALLFAIIAYCTAHQAIRSAGYGDASPLLHIQTAYVLWGMSLLAAGTVIAFIVALARSLRGELVPTHVALD